VGQKAHIKMGLSTAMTFFEAPATLLGLNCVFRKGATHTANQVYCVIGLSLKILVSAQCLYLVLEEVVESKPHVNVTNILLLAFYKGVSIFLFLSVIYFHLCKHQGYCKIISTLSEEAKNIGCYEELYLWLRKYSAIAGAAAFGVIFCMFLVQFTQVNIGPKIHVAHSAVTAFTCVYFEMKFAILAKASKFIFKRINVIIIQAEYNPRKAAKIPSLRKTHDALYFLVEEASANFQCIFIFSTMLQFQVALYASYISCINIWDLEDTFLKIKIQLLLISAIWVFAIVANYIHLTSNCAANLAEVK